ncbi:hypothetical protein AGMMS50262_15680 [Bacteroidia bacterium]|nr:hypothetical protein AGMMS50262_15680 [Bacteroidia bacterium]
MDQGGYCDSMTWKGTKPAPTLKGDDARLEINGSLEFQRGMTNSVMSTVMASNRPHEKITTNGVRFQHPLTFQSSGDNGGWDLQDSLVIQNNVNDPYRTATTSANNDRIYFGRGHLNLNGQYVSCYVFDASEDDPTNGWYNSRTLNIANSTIELFANNNNDFHQGFWYRGGQPLTDTQSQNSLIRVRADKYGINVKPSDTCYNIEFIDLPCNESITYGTYNKITYLTSPGGRIKTGTDGAGTVITDSLLYLTDGNYILSKAGITINKYLGTKDACGGLTYLSSDTLGTQRTITMASGAVVNVKNIRQNSDHHYKNKLHRLLYSPPSTANLAIANRLYR